MLYIETNVNNQTYCNIFNFLHVQYLSVLYIHKLHKTFQKLFSSRFWKYLNNQCNI